MRPTGVTLIALYHFLSALFLVLFASFLAVGGTVLAGLFSASRFGSATGMGLGLMVGVLSFLCPGSGHRGMGYVVDARVGPHSLHRSGRHFADLLAAGLADDGFAPLSILWHVPPLPDCHQHPDHLVLDPATN
jgi:hypothetical protein